MVFLASAARVVKEHVLGVVPCEGQETEALEILSVTDAAFETKLSTRNVHIFLGPTENDYRVLVFLSSTRDNQESQP